MEDKKVKKLQIGANLGFILLFVNILFIATIFNLGTEMGVGKEGGGGVS